MNVHSRWRFLGKVAVVLVISVLSATSKENDKHAGSQAKGLRSDRAGSKEDKSGGFGKDLPTPPAEPKPSSSSHSNQNNQDLSKCTVKENTLCSEAGGDCISCKFEEIIDTCIYGKPVNVSCFVEDSVKCLGDRSFKKEIICQYCYQTPLWQQDCPGVGNCNSVGAPRHYFRANCTVQSNVICLGNRHFWRMMPCNWKNGYRWSTAFILSVTLGGFGADRFYLGRWQEGIGKLFSFGGLGLWTIVDIILIGVRYLGPADGSLYVD